MPGLRGGELRASALLPGVRNAAGSPVRRAQERRVVSVLFVDLVGFTSKSEQLDPEDVRALLTRYYERARAEIERFGGRSRSSSATR